MVDALTLAINQPMYLNFIPGERRPGPRHDVKRRIEQEEFESAFREAHFLGLGSPSFMRSLGWYRKGLTADDPLDKFLAYWNAIEVVASRYYRYVPAIDKNRAKRRAKAKSGSASRRSGGRVRLGLSSLAKATG